MIKQYSLMSTEYFNRRLTPSWQTLGLLSCIFLSACTSSIPERPTDNASHLSSSSTFVAGKDIPSIVAPLPLLSEPQAQTEPELYSVVAQNVPVRELLFAMARDADINIDIHPSISGQISINAINQTLPQILERVSKQIDLRWNYDISGNVLVEPDAPYWHVYQVDYVNVERVASTSVNVSNSIVDVGDGGGAGSNNSVASISQTSTNAFWATLTGNLQAMLDQSSSADGAALTETVVPNPETGLISINANARQHAEIADFIDQVQHRALQQVIIEATIVEVSLSDLYQSGVDWTAIGTAEQSNFNFQQSLGGGTSSPLNNILTISGSDISGQVRLLSQFGDLRVLSSPKIMTLNNQTAMLRVVDNEVYFTIDVEASVVSNGVVTPATFSSTIHTVPVGFVMTVTPQIGDNNQVTLNVRPTISRIVGTVLDPNPSLRQENIENQVPIIQVREMESILKVDSGEIAVLGGLMQDSLEQNTTGLPGISRLPGIRNLFSNRSDTSKKTELIIFIRPVVVKQPSLNGDFKEYEGYLPENTSEFFNQSSFIQPLN